MLFNGRKLVNEGIITNLSANAEEREKQIQQVGVDLRIKNIFKTNGRLVIGVDSNTLPPVIPVEPSCMANQIFWTLEPGGYHVEFHEGCNIPDNVWLQIRQRSSFLRGLGLLHSSVFDPGFRCDHIGTVFFHHNPQGIVLFEGARLAQIIGLANAPVDANDLYGSEAKGSSYQDKTIEEI